MRRIWVVSITIAVTLQVVEVAHDLIVARDFWEASEDLLALCGILWLKDRI